MYRRILVTLDRTDADATILEHIEKLQSSIPSEIVLLHVADGWAARHFEDLKLKISEEMQEDLNYLRQTAEKLSAKGMKVTYHLERGNPADAIIRCVDTVQCDLLAMATHGHTFLEDILYGTTADKVRHHVSVPVLLVREKK